MADKSKSSAVLCTAPIRSSGCDDIIYTLSSYNANGLAGQGSPALGDLCLPDSNNVYNAFILVQETWLSSSNMFLIERFHSDYTAFGVSAMEEALGRSVLWGRPFGGVATLVHKKILKHVQCLKSSERFVILLYCNILIVNVYLPYKCSGSTNQLISVLEEIEITLSLYSDCRIVCGGDFNTDLSIDDQHSRIIREFMSNHLLSLCNNCIKPNCDYTYMHKTLTDRKSLVDYFLISTSLSPCLIRNCVRDDLVNLSDHHPVSISLSLPCLSPFLRDNSPPFPPDILGGAL